MKQLFSYFFLMAAGQGVILAVALVFRKKRPLLNKIHACIIFLSSIILVNVFYLREYPESFLSNFNLFVASLIFFFGPLFYLKTNTLIFRIQYFKVKYLLHGIPFILFNLYLLPFYYTPYGIRIQQYNVYKEQIYANPINILFYIINGLPYLHLLIYTIIIEYTSRKYIKNGYNYYSYVKTEYIIWLKVIQFFVGAAIYIIFISYILNSINWELSQLLEQICHICIFVFLCLSAYLSHKDPRIFKLTHCIESELEKEKYSDMPDIVHNDVDRDISYNKKKYEKTKLSNELVEVYLKKIIDHMGNKKVFTNPDLNLKQLSEQIDLPMHYISQVINSKLKQNFYNFVNTYRIEEAKNVLRDPINKDYSIIDIAFDVGFNSKATFNAIFKKFTHMTPTEFRKKYTIQ